MLVINQRSSSFFFFCHLWEAWIKVHFCRPDVTLVVAQAFHVFSMGKNGSNTNASQKTVKHRESPTNSAGVFACKSLIGFPLSSGRGDS